MKKTGIVTVTFNISKLLEYQVRSINKFCKDKYEFIVFDNSNNQDEIIKIKSICDNNKIRLIKTDFNLTNSHNNPSNNHGLALNYAHNILKNEFDFLFFIDHDLFPIKDFSIEEILWDNIMAGHKQTILNNTYIWPGCLMMTRLNETFDFTPQGSLDTGGGLTNFINNNLNKILFIKHKHEPINVGLNNYYMHEFYDDLLEGTFMHFIKSSNWCNVDESIFNLRQNYLFSILDDFIKKNN
jgi:glycosyltransferase involved in cell wall biosynthesis